MALFDDIRRAVLGAEQDEVVRLTEQALDEGYPPLEIINQALIPALGEVGALFESGELYVPEMLVSAMAMRAGMDLLKPLLVAGEYEPVGKVVMATVQGDIHDIGKSLVTMMLEGRGFEVIDLGVDVPPSHIVKAVEENDAHLVGLSGLLTTSMRAMEQTVGLVHETFPDRAVKVMVGGAPITPEYANDIGADGSAQGASGAVDLAVRLTDGS